MNNGPTMSWTTADILEATGGSLAAGEKSQRFSGIFIDSRKMLGEGLFVAIIGEIHDGHRFVKDVIRQGVKGIVVNRDRLAGMPLPQGYESGIACVVVDSTTKALGDLAAYHRKRCSAGVVAITGSNGKTTTRAMTAGVLVQRFKTLSTTGNLNNEIGLPLTLFQLDPAHEWAVLELGMNHAGEIDRLAQICLPDIGIITNIGPAHLEGVGSIASVAAAKSELVARIKPAGTAVLNADDPHLRRLARKTDKKVCLFGLSADAAVRARSIAQRNLGISFTLELAGEQVSVDINSPGPFMVSNALAAAAAGHLLGLSATEIKTGLEQFRPVQGRMNILETKRGVRIIDDTYNANPDSMSAAIHTLRRLAGSDRCAVVAGDMRELGRQSETLHRFIGQTAAEHKLTRLYVTGTFAQAVASGALSAGMESGQIFTGTREQILADLMEWLVPRDWVLVKGSRAMAMEKIVQGLKAWADT